MSFEKNFERGLRDKRWGGANQHFAKDRPSSEISRDITEALCGSLRDMAHYNVHQSILTVVEEFGRAWDRANPTPQMRLFRGPGSSSEAIAGFQEACQSVLRSEENSNTIQCIYGLAVEALEDADTEDGVALPGRKDAQHRLVVAFLNEVIQTRMQAATVITAQKRKVGPEVVEAQLQEAISQVPLDTIAARFLANKGEKLRAPRAPRLSPVDLAGLSLLKKAPNR